MTTPFGGLPEDARDAAQSAAGAGNGRYRVGTYQHVLFATLVTDEAVQMPDPALGSG